MQIKYSNIVNHADEPITINIKDPIDNVSDTYDHTDKV